MTNRDGPGHREPLVELTDDQVAALNKRSDDWPTNYRPASPTKQEAATAAAEREANATEVAAFAAEFNR